jgi:hypothetical protein
MIDEKAKRKETIREADSAPVVLADGQTWYLPKPWLEVRPVFRGGKPTSVYRVLTCGAELDALIEALADVEDLDGQVVAVASLAAYMLRWNYELDDSELDQLLCFRCSDPTSLQWMRDVFSVATGQSGPKASSAGGD